MATTKKTVGKTTKFFDKGDCITTSMKKVAYSNLVLIDVENNYKEEYQKKEFSIVINNGGKCFGDYSSNSFFFRDIDNPMGCKGDGSYIVGVPTEKTVKEFLSICRVYAEELKKKEDFISYDVALNFISTVEDFLKNGYYEDKATEETTEEVEDGFEEDTIDVYAICKKIMDSSTAEVIRPKFYNKKGVLLVKKYASGVVDGITERLFEDCRKPGIKLAEEKRIHALVSFFKSMNDTNKFINGYEIGFNRLVNMFMSWTDNRYTFNLKDENDLKTIGYAVAVASLKGYVPSGKMFQIFKNRDGCNVVRVVDFIEGFYSWKVDKELTEEEKQEKTLKDLAKKVEELKTLSASLTNTEKMDLLKKIEEVLNIQKVGGIIRHKSA